MSDLRSYHDVFEACSTLAKQLLGQNSIYHIVPTGGASARISKVQGDGRYQIELPTMLPGALLTRHEADRIIGFVLHECAHGKLTNFGLNYPKAMHPLVNALEDIRIERQTIKSKYPENAKELFALTSDQMSLQAMAEHPDLWGSIPAGHPAGIQNYIITQGRVDLGYEANATKAVARQAPQAVKDLYAQFRDEILSTTSTQDVVNLAHKITKAQQDQQQQQQQQGDGEGDEAQDGQQSQKGQKGQQGQKGQKGQQAQSQDQNPGKSNKGSSQDAAPPQIENTISDIAEKQADQSDLDIENQYVQGQVNSLFLTAGKVFLKNLGNLQATAPEIDRAMSAVTNAARLKDQIRRMLKSQDEMSRTRFETAGRLDRRSIARLDTGATNVFGRRDFKEGIRTAVAILIDCSPSMDGRRTAAAQAMGLHLAIACEAAGADTAALIFTESGAGMRQPAVAYLKKWGERVGSVKGAFVSYPQSNGTMLSPGIQMTTKLLLNRRDVNKRILLALTDGECNYGPSITRAMCQDAERAGVDVIGIGCQHDVSGAFPRYANVMQLNDLATTAMAQIIKIMERRK